MRIHFAIQISSADSTKFSKKGEEKNFFTQESAT